MPGRRRRAIPIDTQIEILFRDAWLCHLCHRPLVLHLALKYLKNMVQTEYPAASRAYWHQNWTRQGAPLLDELAASIDHVEAFSRGGAHDISNFAAVCARCNARKSAGESKAFLAVAQPWKVQGKYGEPRDWDGLSSVFVLLARSAPERLTHTERKWFTLLQERLDRVAVRQKRPELSEERI